MTTLRPLALSPSSTPISPHGILAQMPDSTYSDNLPEVLFPPPRRGAKQLNTPLIVSVVRPLTLLDADSLNKQQSGTIARNSSAKLRYSHHQLARLLASGMTEVEASLMTGYTPQHIGNMLRGDPAFQELVHHYAQANSEIWADVEERVATLGLSAMDALLQRLETDEPNWSRRELMDLGEMLLKIRGQAQANRELAKPGAGGVNLNISFVQSGQPKAEIELTGKELEE